MRERVEFFGYQSPVSRAPQEAMQAAVERYERLQAEAANGQLAELVDKNRRAELASFDQNKRQLARDNILHFLSMGRYTNRVKPGPDTASETANLRRAQVELRYLDQLADGGTQPEVTSDAARISCSICRVTGSYSGNRVKRTAVTCGPRQ